jgi:hypothetical protein
LRRVKEVAVVVVVVVVKREEEKKREERDGEAGVYIRSRKSSQQPETARPAQKTRTPFFSLLQSRARSVVGFVSVAALDESKK